MNRMNLKPARYCQSVCCVCCHRCVSYTQKLNISIRAISYMNMTIYTNLLDSRWQEWTTTPIPKLMVAHRNKWNRSTREEKRETAKDEKCSKIHVSKHFSIKKNATRKKLSVNTHSHTMAEKIIMCSHVKLSSERNFESCHWINNGNKNSTLLQPS